MADSLGPVVHTEFAKDIFNVKSNRPFFDGEGCCDLKILVSSRWQLQHFELTFV
jgi:hypothetical protein